MPPIYLDHNATTSLHPEVLEAMLPFFKDNYGNPSSVHGFGRAARVRLDQAREEVASLINASSREIVFTSGGTESDSFAIMGAALALKNKGRHVVTCKIEHAAVINTCKQLELLGFEVEYLNVDSQGCLDPSIILDALRPDTILVSIQHANSEVGTLQDIENIGQIVKGKGVLMHTDAVQTVGKVMLDVDRLPVDLISFSSHKIGGPKGTGALYIRRGSPPLFQLICGGAQEFKRRGGTENVPGIIGFGKGAQIAATNLSENQIHMASLRNELWHSIKNEISDVECLGHQVKRLPNTLGLTFAGIEGNDLLIALDLEGIAVSTGSACSSGSSSPSHVLAAMGLPEQKIMGSLRISLGWNNTIEEINRTTHTLKRLVNGLRMNEMKEKCF